MDQALKFCSPLTKLIFQFSVSGLEADTCSAHEERPPAIETYRIFNELTPNVANMHLYFPCSLQAQRDLPPAGRYALPTVPRRLISPWDQD
jgi:hypothetical protein